MSPTIPDFDFQSLSSPQKLELIGWLWDSIPDSTESLPFPESHRQELEQRLAEADANPNAAIPWEQVRGRLRQKP